MKMETHGFPPSKNCRNPFCRAQWYIEHGQHQKGFWVAVRGILFINLVTFGLYKPSCNHL